jgi:hypothetical protein
MKNTFCALVAALTVPFVHCESATPDTPVAVVSNVIVEVAALATNHAELADFPAYVKRLQAQSAIAFQKDIKPLAVSFATNITPVLTKRRIRPSDFGTNGILLHFELYDETNLRQAPLDTVTCFPNLKLTLYAEVVLWEKASPELKKQLEDIIGRHKAMLKELDMKKAANKAPEDTSRKLADPQQ